MRWVRKNKKRYHGDTRIKSGFLFFPKTIHNETRWLEHATWTERFTSGSSWESCFWYGLEWLDDSEKGEA